MRAIAQILVVDDDPLLLRASVRLLKSADYDVLEAATGQAALQILEAHTPDLILLDVQLPDANGIALCQRLKADEGLRESHILMFSATHIGSQDQADGLKAGADGYITRPISNTELLARVEAMLRIQRAEKALRQSNAQLSEINARLEREVAERQRIEQALRKSEEKLRDYTQHLEDLVRDKVQELDYERAKVVQTAKMAAVGEVATGVAHELNQPLTAILLDAGYLKTVAHKTQETSGDFSLDPEEIYEIGGNLEEDVARCRRIVDHLRAFGRVAGEHTTSVDLNRPLKDTFVLIGTRLRNHGVRIQWELTEDLPYIAGDPHKLEQVFLNIISNAEYAMETREQQIAAGEVPQVAYQKTLTLATFVDGQTVVVEISDNGCGIPAAVQSHIFEPFFTTKPEGKGTGLGLSISYNIVTELGGRIIFESHEGSGTKFSLRFPILAEQV